MPIAYSNDLRKRVIEKRKSGKAVSEIVSELSVSKTFVYDMLALERETGDIKPKEGKPGPAPLLGEADLERIREAVERAPDMALEEIKDELGLDAAISTICNAINHKLNLRRKKKHFMPPNKTGPM